MSSEKPTNPTASTPGDGIRSVRTTGVFRAVNFELYVKPNKVIMALGILAISACSGYLLYMRSKYESMGYYVAVKEDGTQQLHQRKSRWE